MTNRLAGVLPVPVFCDACASPNIRHVKTNSKTAHWPYAWVCGDCSAFVSCHPNTLFPVGYMADQKTRALRKECHAAFDVLWRERLMTREKAYNWLAAQLNISREEMHISWLSPDQLKIATKVSAEFYAENEEALKRRKAKNDKRREQQEQRSFAQHRREVERRKQSRRY